MAEFAFLHFPADAVQVDPLKLSRLPASAQAVFAAVRAQGPLTHQNLRDATGLPPRTIRYAVRRLKDAGLLETRCSLRDCRTCYFFVHRRCVGVEALEAARESARSRALEIRLLETRESDETADARPVLFKNY